jgi:hypothetical protein
MAAQDVLSIQSTPVLPTPGKDAVVPMPDSKVSKVGQNAIKSQTQPLGAKEKTFAAKMMSGMDKICLKLKHIFETIFSFLFCFPEVESIELKWEEGSSNKLPLEGGKKVPVLDENQKLAAELALLANECGQMEKKNEEIHAIRAKLLQRASVISQELALENMEGPFSVHGLPNITGGNCYMNAALQSLEALFRKDPAFLALVNSDLSLGEKESLLSLEEKLLKQWAPVDVSQAGNREKIQEKITDAQLKLVKLQDPDKKSLTEKVKILKDINWYLRQHYELEDALLFKWSFLLLMKAKKTGSCEKIREALQIHHDICFGLQNNPEYQEEDNVQKDSASYLELWYNSLPDFSTYLKTQRVSTHENREIRNEGNVVNTNPMMQLPLISSLKSQMPQLLHLIGNFMTEIVSKGEAYFFESAQVAKDDYRIETRFAGPPPEILTLHVKRFTATWDKSREATAKLGKDSTPINLGFNPDERVLNMGIFFPNENGQYPKELYALSSIIVHSGGMNASGSSSGHYISYVLDETGKWRECDDSNISKPIPVSEVPFSNAYVFNFRRLARP